MITISHLSVLLLFTLSLSVLAKLNLYAADHLAIFTILKNLGVAGQLHRPVNFCNATGIACELSINSKESYVLKVTGIVFKTQRLRGFISPVIGQLSELKELSLPNNYLVNRIPPQIANCRKLEILHVGNNRLSGYVPGELSSLLHLRILNLSSNMFSGDLSFLKYFPNLEKLSVNNNMFSGKLPASLRSFPKLWFCNISDNRFLKAPQLSLKQLESLSPELKKTNYKRDPKRYILAELTDSSKIQTGNKSSGSNSPHASSPMETPNNKRSKNRKSQDTVILIYIGLPTTFLICLGSIECILALKRSTSANQAIFSPLIKAKELAFLNDDEAVAEMQLIGRGGCGEVYKREIPKGKIKTIAIKEVIQTLGDAGELTEEHTTFQNRKKRQIWSEIKTVGHIHHPHLLPLLAYVVRPTSHYLVYEFMKNGSLQDIMQQVNNGTRELDWLTRHKIAVGVASGLEYLHFNHTPCIVHRDLKPANILLNDNMEALITDFGLAKSIPVTKTFMTTENISGTFGYIAPEYRETMKFTDKCDIYSFGVVLGFLVMGKLPSDEFFQNTPELTMVRWMRKTMTSDKRKQAIHSNLLGNGYEEQMLQVLKIACLCTHHDPQERPTSEGCRIMLAQIMH